MLYKTLSAAVYGHAPAPPKPEYWVKIQMNFGQ
jgi:hypothetical protein